MPFKPQKRFDILSSQDFCHSRSDNFNKLIHKSLWAAEKLFMKFIAIMIYACHACDAISHLFPFSSSPWFPFLCKWVLNALI